MSDVYYVMIYYVIFVMYGTTYEYESYNMKYATFNKASILFELVCNIRVT